MHRLRCGIIYTNAFGEHLATLHQKEVPDNFGKVLSLDYVRVASGEQKGREWWRMEWVIGQQVPEGERFLINAVPVCINKQSQRGLKDRCLDCRAGTVVIRSS